jgi:hypothetical protein
LGFIGEHGLVEERQREGAVTGPGSGRRAVPACTLGAWQPLGIGGPTWLSGGRPAEAARAVGEAAQRHVGEGRAAQACSRRGKRPAVADHGRAAETGEIRDLRKMMEDLGAIS